MCVCVWGGGGGGGCGCVCMGGWVGRWRSEVSERVREVAGGSRHRWKEGSLSTPSSLQGMHEHHQAGVGLG